MQSLDKLMVHCNVALETEHIDGFLSISAEVCVMIKKVLYFLGVEKQPFGPCEIVAYKS